MIDLRAKVAETLAERVKEKLLSGVIKVGQRLIMKDYDDGILLSAANKLAGFAHHGLAGENLKKRNVVYVRSDAEAAKVAEYNKVHSSRQSCSSYCINIRDSGETAIFFVPRSVEVFLDESLRSKGSVESTEIRSFVPKAVITATIRKVLESSNIPGGDLEEIAGFVWERFDKLSKIREFEDLAYCLVNNYLSLTDWSNYKDAEHCKKLGLIPFGAEEAAEIGHNLVEIENLRQAMANLKLRKKYREEHIEYNREKWECLEEHLDHYGKRVPLESEQKTYLKTYLDFFDNWPSECDLAFIRCSPGLARITIKLCRQENPREKLPYTKDGKIQVLDSDIFDLNWVATTNLQNYDANLKINRTVEQRGIKIGDRRLSIDVNQRSVHVPVGEISTIALYPDPAAECPHKLARNSRNTLDFIRLSDDHFQVILDIGGHKVWSNERQFLPSRELMVKSEREITVKINAYLDRQTVPASDLNYEIEAAGHDIRNNSFSVPLGELVELKLKVLQPESFSAKLDLFGIEAEVIEEKGKVVESRLEALLDARADKDLFPPVKLEHSVAAWPKIEITCDNYEKLQREYETSDSWHTELLSHILKNPEDVMPKSFVFKGGKVHLCDKPLDTKDGTPWNYNPNLFSDEFIKSRKNLFKSLAERKETLPYANLISLKDKICSYVKEYHELINAAVGSGRYLNEYSFLSLVDSFLFSEDSEALEGHRFPDNVLHSSLYILAPTHPILLMWLMNRQELLERIISDSTWEMSAIACEILNGEGFPALLCLPDGTVLRHLKGIKDRFFTVYAPENLNPERAVSSLSILGSKLNTDCSEGNSLLPESDKIHSALEYAHRMLPYRRDLKIFYENAGGAENLRDALGRIDRAKDKPRGLHEYYFNKERLVPKITLCDTGVLSIGSAFERDKRKEDPSTEKTQVRISRPGKIFPDDSTDFDVCFGDVSSNYNFDHLIKLEDCPHVLPFHNLLCPRIERSRFSEDGTGSALWGFVHPPGKNQEIGDFTRLNHEYQTLFRKPQNEIQMDNRTARAIKVDCGLGFYENITKLQDACSFLFCLDSGAGLGFFDNLARWKENLIIDYDTDHYNPVATAISVRLKNRHPHNYVITTRKNETIRYRIKSVLREILNESVNDVNLDTGTEKIIYSLNGLSGKYLREVLQRSLDVKEAVACGLTQLFLRKISSLFLSEAENSERNITSVIIPIDDHWERWIRLAQPDIKESHHADLMFLSVCESEDDDFVQIWPRFIEVKYRSDNIIPAEAYRQIENTWSVFCKWLLLLPEEGRPDEEFCKFRMDNSIDCCIRSLDIASMLEFYLLRTGKLFPELKSKKIQLDDDFRRFLTRVISKVRQGKSEILFDYKNFGTRDKERLARGEDVVAGDIILWGPFDQDSPAEEKGILKVKQISLGCTRAKEMLEVNQ